MSTLKRIWVLNKDRFPIETIHTIVFDFDGVFTDNYVYVNSQGDETVRCSRADSYGVNLLNKAIKNEYQKISCFVLSTETNPVVSARCRKMGIDSYSGFSNKWEFLENWLDQNRPGIIPPEQGLVFFGNDLNDLEAMSHSGFSISPSDAHPAVKQISSFVLDSSGGQGFVREGIEFILNL